jgi:hypothetical protein
MVQLSGDRKCCTIYRFSCVGNHLNKKIITRVLLYNFV